MSSIAEQAALAQKAIEDGDISGVQSVLGKYPDLPTSSNLPGIPMPLLHSATRLSNNFPEIVDLLLSHGGDPNCLATVEQVSACHLAVMFDFDVVLERLIQHGGDPEKKNGKGKTCYDLAKENFEEEMLELEKCFLYFCARSGKSHVGATTVLQNSVVNLSTCMEDVFDGGFEPNEVLRPEETIQREVAQVPEAGVAGVVVNDGTNAEWVQGMYLMTEDELDENLSLAAPLEVGRKKQYKEATQQTSPYHHDFDEPATRLLRSMKRPTGEVENIPVPEAKRRRHTRPFACRNKRKERGSEIPDPKDPIIKKELKEYAEAHPAPGIGIEPENRGKRLARLALFLEGVAESNLEEEECSSLRKYYPVKKASHRDFRDFIKAIQNDPFYAPFFEIVIRAKPQLRTLKDKIKKS